MSRDIDAAPTSTPQMGIDAAGTVYVIGRDSQSKIMISRRAAGSATWDSEALLGECMPVNCKYSLTVPPEGAPLVAFTSASSQQIKVYRYDGGAWVSDTPTHFSVTGAVLHVAISANSRGEAILFAHSHALAIAWRRDEDGNWDVSPSDVDGSGSSFETPAASIDDDGNARVFWKSGNDIRSSRKPPGEPWEDYATVRDIGPGGSFEVSADSVTGNLMLTIVDTSSIGGFVEHVFLGGTIEGELTLLDGGASQGVVVVSGGVVPERGFMGAAAVKEISPNSFKLHAGLKNASTGTWEGGTYDFGAAEPPFLASTRLAGGDTLVLLASRPDPGSDLEVRGLTLDDEHPSNGPEGLHEIHSMFDAPTNFVIRADAEGNAVAAWYTGSNLFTADYDGPAPAGGGGSSGSGSGSGSGEGSGSGGSSGSAGGSGSGSGTGSGGGSGEGSGSGGSSGGSGAGGSSGGGSGGGSGTGGSSGGGSGGGTGGGSGTGGGTGGEQAIGPVSPTTIPRAPEVTVQGSSVTMVFQEFNGVAESAQKRKKRKKRSAGRVRRMLAAMVADERVSLAAVRAFAKRNKFSFDYEAEVVRQSDGTQTKKSRKIKKVTKRNELTLRDLESGRYSTRYRVRITSGRGKQAKKVASTKWSPSTEFTIA